MRSSSILAGALTAALCLGAAAAEELKSATEPGGRVPTYNATKAAGIADGVAAGASLCYT